MYKEKVPFKYVVMGDCHFGVAIVSKSNFLKKDLLPNAIEIVKGRPTILSISHYWEEDIADKPFAVVVFCGINDILANEICPVTYMKEIISKIILSTKKSDIVLILNTIQPFDKTKLWTEARESWADDYNKWLRNLSKTESFLLVDVAELAKDKLRDGWKLSIPWGVDKYKEIVANLLRAAYTKYLEEE